MLTEEERKSFQMTGGFCDGCKKNFKLGQWTWHSEQTLEGITLNSIDFCSEQCYEDWENEHSAQKWLDRRHFPARRSQVKIIRAVNENLTGNLDLTEFVNLEILRCENNYLKKIFLPANNKIKGINCGENRFLSPDFFLKINADILEQIVLAEHLWEKLNPFLKLGEELNIALFDRF